MSTTVQNFVVLKPVKLFRGADRTGGELGDMIRDENVAPYRDAGWPRNARAWRCWLGKGSTHYIDPPHAVIVK